LSPRIALWVTREKLEQGVLKQDWLKIVSPFLTGKKKKKEQEPKKQNKKSLKCLSYVSFSINNVQKEGREGP
jgi:hypothetical protein